MRFFPRGLLTDALIDALEAAAPAAVLIGDGAAPPAGGWSGGQPGRGEFRAYVVLGQGVARPNQRDPVGRENSSWVVGYSLRAVGGSRQQADWAADRLREVCADLAPRRDIVEGWGLQRVAFDVLGPPQRNDATDPPYWEATDSVSLWLEPTHP